MDEDQLKQVLTWERMLEFSEQATKETGKHYVCCGALVWRLVRDLCEERLRVPLKGDILWVNGEHWILSLHVNADAVCIVPAKEVTVMVPIVLTATPNDDLPALSRMDLE